ncbi:multiple sugar transport system permease protein [Demequina lutea]|uniref:Multiple sugar transport system permease protein n=2 Tax=Demequina lutea TaxID=431489 RepID=A0A7Y9ZDY2_9MICO|nr:sugar ABC transporter permease [Demequina lutea]NYI42473.1 multiple sugar transport system permease protein [Demequina lutea]
MTQTMQHPRRTRLAWWRGPSAGNRLAFTAFLAPAVVYVLAYFAYPAIQNVIMSFQDYSATTFFTGEAPWVGLQNYRDVFGSPIFGTTVLNTLLFTAGSIVGQFVIGLLLAIFFSRRFPLNSVLRALLLLPWLIPLISSSSIWRWMLDPESGVINYVLLQLHMISTPIPWLTSPSLALLAVVIVNVWLGIPFNVTILYGGIKEVPSELYEAAALDGATGVRAFRYITWPLLRPVVTIVLVLGVIYTLKVFDIIIGLTGGGPANSTQTLATNSYQLSFGQFLFGQGAAVSNILIVFSMLFAALYLFRTRRQADAA